MMQKPVVLIIGEGEAMVLKNYLASLVNKQNEKLERLKSSSRRSQMISDHHVLSQIHQMVSAEIRR